MLCLSGKFYNCAKRPYVRERRIRVSFVLLLLLRTENNHFLSKGFEGWDASRSFRVFGASKFEVLEIYPPKLGLAIGANTYGDPVFEQLFCDILATSGLKRFYEASEDFCGSNHGSCVL